MSNTVNPHKAHFDVAHRLFCLIFKDKTKKETEVEYHWNTLVDKAKKAGTPIPAETIKNFSEARPDLAHRLSNTPA